MSYIIGNSGNSMIDGDDGSHPSSPNNTYDYCKYCGCRIDCYNNTSYDDVCEDCIEEHELNLNEIL